MAKRSAIKRYSFGKKMTMRTTRTLGACLVATLMIVIALLVWRSYVTLQLPPFEDEIDGCALHGVPFRLARTSIWDCSEVYPDPEYMDVYDEGHTRYPNDHPYFVLRMVLPTQNTRWRYVMRPYCSKCDAACHAWMKALPDERAILAQQPLRYVRPEKLRLRLCQTTNGVIGTVAGARLSTNILDDILTGRKKRRVDTVVLFELSQPLTYIDAQPWIEIARKHAISNEVIGL